jgi:hypothetical protein
MCKNIRFIFTLLKNVVGDATEFSEWHGVLFVHCFILSECPGIKHPPPGSVANKTYNQGIIVCVKVKEEDLDWWIYHILAEEPDQDGARLSEKTGCTASEVAESLTRLEKFLLVERLGETYRIRSIQEMLLSCQGMYDDSAPFIIDNGVIRERKRPE